MKKKTIIVIIILALVAVGVIVCTLLNQDTAPTAPIVDTVTQEDDVTQENDGVANEADVVIPEVEVVPQTDDAVTQEHSDEVPLDSVTTVLFQPQFDDFSNEACIIQGCDETESVIWSYESAYYPMTELERISEIGIIGEQYIFVEGGVVKSFNLQTGALLWENIEFAGASPAFVYDATRDCIYLAGYYGPSFFAISMDGNTLCRLDLTDVIWPSSLELINDDGSVLITSFDQAAGTSTAKTYIDLSDFSVT